MVRIARVLPPVIALFVLFAPPAAGAAEAQTPGKPASVLSQFAFLAGSWRGEHDGAVIEEHWSAAVGTSISGISRVVAGAAPRMYELCAIEQSPEGIVMWMRHFGPGLVGGDASPQRWTLASAGRGEAVFERPEGGERLTYRVAGRGRLEITLRKDGKDIVFRYARVR